ncbi:MAG: GBS Bsp-like repeat-containing protein [Lachnospiraceae bacterium]|nr:GBS Bsp-like repeat-containing protein [Lachnospiraceae bacterium]
MRNKIICAITVTSLLAGGIWFTPKANETEISLMDQPGSEQSDVLLGVGEGMPGADIELTAGDGLIMDGGIDISGGSSDELLGNGSGPAADIIAQDTSNGEIGADDSDILLDDEDIEDAVPDEPDNAVDTEEDDYFETDAAYIYDDRPFDASYITGKGVDRIRRVIVAYAESLGGTFRSPYYKGGQPVSIQCCAYVNQVWKHVFGKDIYDTGVMTTTSHEGETIYNFLDRTGARAGDILYVRYWKVKKNDWSSHFMILLDYDKTGVYVTDGYETDDGEFLVWRIDKKAIYSQSNFFKKTGSDRDKPNSVHWTGKDGSFFKLYRMRQEEWCSVANSTYDEYETDPMVRSSFARINRAGGTYTITSIIHSVNGLDRVQFPVWTVADGQDDLMADYETDEAASGEIEPLDDDLYRVTYTVNIADHNNECGNYMAEMYMYDTMGVLITYQCDAVNMDGAAGSVCVDPIPWSLE